MFGLSERDFNFTPVGVGPADSKSRPATQFNLLLVPYPYQVDAAGITDGGACLPDGDGTNPAHFFELKQTWLVRIVGETLADKAKEFAGFLVRLALKAEAESGDTVHGVVLPELALHHDMIGTIQAELCEHLPKLEVFITGIARAIPSARNMVSGSVFKDNNGKRIVYDSWLQSKHHRWRIDRRQADVYGLTNLIGNRNWWEKISVEGRECTFYVFRPGASLTTLVCEDLAPHPSGPAGCSDGRLELADRPLDGWTTVE